MTTQIITDTLDEYDWATRQSVFDADGYLLQEILTYDDGRTRTTTLVDGITTSIQFTDPLNAAPWTSISQMFSPADGVQTERRIAFDDGRTITEYFYRNGGIARRELADTKDAFSWYSQTSDYNLLGDLTQRVVHYDDGRSVETKFTNGVPTIRDVRDGTGDNDWMSRTFFFDANGALQSLRTVFDSGVVETRTSFVGPASGTVTRTDLDDRFDWHSIETTYDRSGQREQVVRVNDDGVQGTTIFDNGMRTKSSWLDVDDTQKWTFREAVYDRFGRLSHLTQQMDDGVEINRTYVSGRINQRFDIDTFDAAAWFTRTFDYNAFGQMETSRVVRDNGVVVTKHYALGVLTDVFQEDTGDVHAWDTIRKVYQEYSGRLLFVTRTEDDGTQTHRDARGVEIITGGTEGTVAEDTGHTLVAQGQITFVDGYRGSESFAIQHGYGSLGAGYFTVYADGNWTYYLLNNLPEVQRLNAGETAIETFVATTDDGLEITLEATVEGRDDTPEPLYLGGYFINLGVQGNLASHPLSLDLATLFSDDQGDDLAFSLSTPIPGYTITDGVITADDPTSLPDPNVFGFSNSGVYTFPSTSLIATDSDGNSTTAPVFVNVQFWHHFGSDFASSGNETVKGHRLDDRLEFGDNAAAGGQLIVRAGEGNDKVVFGHLAGANSGRLDVLLASGNDQFTAGINIAHGAGLASIHSGLGNDVLVFGAQAAHFGGILQVFGEQGADDIRFGRSAAERQGDIDVSGGSENDFIGFDDEAAVDRGDVTVRGDEGDDVIAFGDQAGINSGTVDVGGGADNDTITFGTDAGRFSGSITVTGGDGNDAIALGDRAGAEAGRIFVAGGTGNDTISIGANSGVRGQYVFLFGETGSDTITVGTGSQGINIDLGLDSDADIVNIGASLTGRITNWVQGQDTINVSNAMDAVWTAADDGADRVLRSNAGHDLTITGAAGVDAVDILGAVTLNEAPTFSGTSNVLPNIEIGSEASAYMFDLQTIFSDTNTSASFPDTLTFTHTALPTGVTITNGVITLTDILNFSLTGNFTFDVTATDYFGEAVTQTLTLDISQHHDYGDFEPVFYLTDYVTGSMADDRMIVGDVFHEATNEGSEFDFDSGAGNDTVTVGTVTIDSDYSLFHIDTGTGDDVLTISGFLNTGTGSSGRIIGGTGADVLTFTGAVDGAQIDLGSDVDADTLIFLGTVESGTIENWTHGIDSVDVVDHTLWAITLDDGTDTTLSDGTSTLTFLGVSGLSEVDDFLL